MAEAAPLAESVSERERISTFCSASATVAAGLDQAHAFLIAGEKLFQRQVGGFPRSERFARGA